MAKKILLADDSMTIQKVVELTFMDQDYEVTAVSDGSSAVAALEQTQPDIVIADVHMPGADGYAVCRHSKGKSPGTPVLLLVGTFEQFDEQQASQAGADDHLKKPFDSQELLLKVEEMVAGGGAAPAPAAPETAPELTTQMAAPEPAPPAPEPAAPAPEPVAPSQDFTAPEPVAPEPVAPSPALSQDFTAPEPAAPEPGAPAPEHVALSQDFTSPEPAAPEPTAPEVPPAQALETVAVSQSEPMAPEPDAPELQPSTAETRPRRAEEPDEAPPAGSAESAEPAAAASPNGDGDGDGSLSDEDVERIARRVVELASAEVLQAVAWEVIPDLAEVVIRERIQELEGQVD